MTKRRSRGYRGLLASVFDLPWLVVGRPGPIVRRLLGIVVGTTLLILPLATLLVLQLRFLAYQDQTVTW